MAQQQPPGLLSDGEEGPVSVPDSSAPPRAADDDVVAVSAWRRWIILFVVCWLPIPMTFGTSSVMAVTPEVASDLKVDETAIHIANAGVFVAMAMSPLIWNPIARLVGRRVGYLLAAAVMCLCSLGAALAPNLAAFAAIWVIGGSTGVVFLVSGQTILSDIFEPTTRGTAVGFFLGTCVSANTVAPLTGGVIATYTSWRVIYGVQAAMSFFGLVMAWFLVPKDVTPAVDLGFRTSKPTSQCLRTLVSTFSPKTVFKMFLFPNILLADIACGLLSFNQYGLLSSIRFSVGERFGLNTPLTSGLFYLAPGGGFLLGSTIGGRISDHTVKRYLVKRNGLRLPRDRLRSGLGAMFLVLPLGTLLFGWGLQDNIGGMALPAVSAFFAGAGLMWSFSGLNTYSAEVHPPCKTEVISSKYIIQYSFSAVTMATRVIMMESIGIGWSFTITAITGFLAGVIVLFLIRYEPKTEKLMSEEK